jgi:multiple sugar transport system substrate-binding protein
MATTYTTRPTSQPPQRPSRLARRDFLATLLLASGGASLLAACGGTAAVTATTAATSIVPVTTTAATSASTASAATSSVSGAAPTSSAASSSAATSAPASATVSAAASQSASALTTTAAPTVAPAVGAAKAAGTLDIMSWTLGDDAWAASFFESFNKASPGTTVNVSIGDDNKFLVTVSAGSPPDLFYTGRSALADWGIQGVALRLDDRIAKSKVISKDNFIAHALEEGGWQGKVYGLYWSADARMFYWNKDLFQTAGLDPEQPPQTWDDFSTAMQKLTKTGTDGTIQQLGINPTYDSVGAHYWEAWFWELGGSYLSSDGTKVTIANDMGANALDWMVKQAQIQGGWDKITTYWTAAGKDAGKNTSSFGWGFGLQKVAMFIEVGDAITSLQKLWPSVHYGLGGIPAASTGKRASVRGGYYWVIPSKAAHPDTAWDYMEWSFTLDQTLAYNNHYNRIPTTNDAVNSAKWLPDNPTARKVSSEVVAYSQRIPCIAPGYADILKVNGGIPGPVLEGKQTPQVALQNAQTQIQGILDTALKG